MVLEPAIDPNVPVELWLAIQVIELNSGPRLATISRAGHYRALDLMVSARTYIAWKPLVNLWFFYEVTVSKDGQVHVFLRLATGKWFKFKQPRWLIQKDILPGDRE